MSSSTRHSVSPYLVFLSAYKNRELILSMIKREILGRYKGSVLGLLWSFFNPLLLLAVYTFCFSVVFKAKWNVQQSQSHADYALILFAGLIIHGIFAEIINRAPQLIVSNVNFVKKIVFPLEILPSTILGSSLFHAGISFFVLLAGLFILNGHFPWTVLYLPLVIFPFLVLVMGFAWFLSAAGVYIRDIGQITGIVTTVMLFISPIFYPLSALPKSFRLIASLNPLTLIIEETRKVLLFNAAPDWQALGIYFLVSLLVAWVGFTWFQKTRKGFADVL